MKMMKWLLLFVFSFSLISGCSHDEVQTEKKVDAKQIEKKDEKKQEENKEEGNQEQKTSAEQKQEEKSQEEKAADQKSIEQDQSQTKAAEPSQNQKEQTQEQPRVVNEPKERPKQEDAQQPKVNQVSPKPPEPPVAPKPQVKMITLLVRDDQRTILGGTEVELQDGDTVFKVLGRTLKKKGIQMEYTGSGSGVYVQGINNLYEKDKGSGSGWMYRVNGVNAKVGAGKYQVKQGDKIEWFYTLDYRKENR